MCSSPFEMCTSNSGFRYIPVYMSNDDFVEIVVNTSMGTDYFIDRMCDELHKVAVNYTDCEHLGSPDSNLGHSNGMV
jgi:hypothetical protein